MAKYSLGKFLAGRLRVLKTMKAQQAKAQAKIKPLGHLQPEGLQLKYLQQYLQGYAEPAAAFFETNKIHNKDLTTYFHTTTYSHTLIIPAYNESTAFIRQLMQQHFNGCARLLVIIVVNQPAQKYSAITRLNQRLFDFFISSSAFKCTPLFDDNSNTTHPLAVNHKGNIDFLCINSCKTGVNPKQGVGYARKLGCDIALHLMQKKIIDLGWLHCTDADATLPSDYFKTPSIHQNSAKQAISALVYQFEHQFLPQTKGFYQIQTEQANALYQKSILYYRDGLIASGSPYAFTTLGSAMAINPKHYCQVRGVPKRAAGEDFYLLNKLAKLAPVIELTHTIILKPRASQRVPFGTGPAIKLLLQKKAFLDYNPKVFVYLKEAISFLPQLYTCIVQQPNNAIPQPPSAHLNATTWQALQSIGLEQLLIHLKKQAKNPAQALRMSHEWFDGFRTLKFIHALTNGPYPKVGLENLPYSAKNNLAALPIKK